jgi:hypothetical protein
MSVGLNAFDANGNLITGAGVRNPITITLAAGQEYTKLVTELFGFQSFDGWIEADASATGLSIFVATGSIDMQHLDGNTVGNPSADFMVFHTGASAILVNPSSKAATVTLTILGTGASQSLTIAPRTRFVTTLSGVTRIRSSEPLAAIEQLTAAEGRVSTAAVPVSLAQSTLVFPDTLVGAGYSCILTIANAAAAQQKVLMSFGSSSTSITIPPNASIRVSISDLLHLPQNSLITGALRISADSPSLIGIVDIQTEAQIAIAPAYPAATNYTFLNVLNGNGFFTGLAFASQNAAPLIRIDLYDSAGDLVTSGAISLGANGEFSKLLSELVPPAATQSRGYIRIHSDEPIWAWEIFGSARTVASAPPL